MATLRFNPVGQCIYCGSFENLTDEHVIPLGLGGDHILPNSSCTKCNAITSSFEQSVLRGLWWLTRAVLKFPSRRPDEMPSSYTLRVETKDGEKKEITLGEDEKFAVAGFLLYTPPVFDAPQIPYAQGILITGHFLVGFGNSLEGIAAKYNLDSIEGTVTYKGTSLARMLAKMAWGFAVGSFGLENFEEVYVRNCILNKKDDVGMWVGTDYSAASDAQLTSEGKSRHACGFSVDAQRNVRVRVRLFSFSPYSPAYVVVVGRLKESAPTSATQPVLCE